MMIMITRVISKRSYGLLHLIISVTFTGSYYIGFVRNQKKKSSWSQRAKEITGAFILLIANLKVSECFNFREKGYRIIC